jgi:hypothetical protein
MYEEYGFLGRNSVQFGKSPRFRRKIPPPSLELNNKPSNKPAESGKVTSQKILFFIATSATTSNANILY